MSAMDIKQIRKQLGMTKAEFARKLGVSRMSVWRWEAGKSTPDQRVRRDMQKLLGGKNEMRTS